MKTTSGSLRQPRFFIQFALCCFLLLLGFAAHEFAASALAYAAPLPPRIVVNHKTRECAQVVPGDECGDIVLPQDWEYLEPDTVQCPADYAMVELQAKWVHFKAPHCCSEGHSGSRGDCQDVVLHSRNQQCAFVDDISQCPQLPAGWESWGKDCPVGFEWSEDLACQAQAPGQTISPTLEPPPLIPATPPPALAQTTSPVSEKTGLPEGLTCCGTVVAPLVILAAARRRRPGATRSPSGQ